jgi:hypothetical protein
MGSAHDRFIGYIIKLYFCYCDKLVTIIFDYGIEMIVITRVVQYLHVIVSHVADVHSAGCPTPPSLPASHILAIA